LHDICSFWGTLTASAMTTVIVAFTALSEACKSRQAVATIGKIGAATRQLSRCAGPVFGVCRAMVKGECRPIHVFLCIVLPDL
jgi:hypothetical protein